MWEKSFLEILFWPTFSWFSRVRVQVSVILFRWRLWILDVKWRFLIADFLSWKDLRFNEKLETISTTHDNLTMYWFCKLNGNSNARPQHSLSDYNLLIWSAFCFSKTIPFYTSNGFFNEPNPFWANFQHFIIVLHIK